MNRQYHLVVLVLTRFGSTDYLMGLVHAMRSNGPLPKLHVEQIMQDAGWFEKSLNGPADVGDLTTVVPDVLQSGKYWTAVVQHKRQELIDKR